MADAALLKDIPIKENIEGQFQFQAFNVFNHPALDIPKRLRCTLRGLLCGWCDYQYRREHCMRQLQFAFRVEF